MADCAIRRAIASQPNSSSPIQAKTATGIQIFRNHGTPWNISLLTCDMLARNKAGPAGKIKGCCSF